MQPAASSYPQAARNKQQVARSKQQEASSQIGVLILFDKMNKSDINLLGRR
jgi:hypothetical protein